MTLTEDILREKFEEYNELYFENELPTPDFRLLKSYSTCGYFSCKKLIGKRLMKGQRLEISCYFDWKEEDLRDVILHEMIHYYLGYKHIDNDLSHGKEFIEMSKKLNVKYGFNISIKIDCSKFRRTKNAPKLSWALMRLFM